MSAEECELSVATDHSDGKNKTWCKTHNAFHEATFEWGEHATHSRVHIPFRHILYTAYRCLECPDAPLLLDEEV